jgi:hypothetical protein
MVEGSREPNVLVAGKRFHRGVQAPMLLGSLAWNQHALWSRP